MNRPDKRDVPTIIPLRRGGVPIGAKGGVPFDNPERWARLRLAVVPGDPRLFQGNPCWRFFNVANVLMPCQLLNMMSITLRKDEALAQAEYGMLGFLKAGYKTVVGVVAS